MLFAMTRVLAAGMMAAREKGGGDVTYACAAMPPEFLSEAVVSAGGRITVERDPVVVASAPRDTGELADAAFRALAERLQVREGCAMEVLLQRLEDATLESCPNKEQDEEAYWTRISPIPLPISRRGRRTPIAGSTKRSRTSPRSTCLSRRTTSPV